MDTIPQEFFDGSAPAPTPEAEVTAWPPVAPRADIEDLRWQNEQLTLATGEPWQDTLFF